MRQMKLTIHTIIVIFVCEYMILMIVIYHFDWEMIV